MLYDFLVVGAGPYGASFARAMKDRGRRVLVIDKRRHIAGNTYTDFQEGILVHRYGAHIFHTDDPGVWAFVNRFARFTPYIHSPVAFSGGKRYSLPFNMNTFRELWGVATPEEAAAVIAKQRTFSGTARNLEEEATGLLGTEIYEKLIKGYTQKQWGRPCDALPAGLIRRVPLRFTWDNRYFSDRYQGVPEDGYTAMTERMLEGIDVELGVDHLEDRGELRKIAGTVLYTGPIDAYFDYRFGPLAYRSVRFETETLDTDDYQGAAVVNYTDLTVPYTRVIEHKHLGAGPKIAGRTVISREYSEEWAPGAEPAYPVNDEKNNAIYRQYAALASWERGVIFGGRLAGYRYCNMDEAIASALTQAAKLI